MTKSICKALVAIFISFAASMALAEVKGEPDKYYLFIGKLDQLPVSALVNTPTDTFPGYAEEVEQLGGKLHSYYFAVKDTTMYAVVSFPSHIEAAAQVYQRGAIAGVAKDIQLIEILTSEQMVEVFGRAKKHQEYVVDRMKSMENTLE